MDGWVECRGDNCTVDADDWRVRGEWTWVHDGGAALRNGCGAPTGTDGVHMRGQAAQALRPSRPPSTDNDPPTANSDIQLEARLKLNLDVQ